ncbi:MAG TPA: matrixin family metalloprotease [Candidatus Thermoplasmatota archaeon]|nr:matrixin family metalloprotease [Candidatus Thermoplasmatota archaeon]
MNLKLILVGLAAAAMLLPVGAALPPVDFPLEHLLPTDFTCEQGAHTTSFPDPTHPDLIVNVHIQCPDPNPGMILDTDCTGTSWSHWIGPIKAPWTYTYDTTNPFGFSQSAVNSAWSSSSTVWEAATSPATNIFDGFVNGGTGANSGTYDSFVLAEFRLLGGQLRNAVGVQWAWQGSGADAGKIIHTDAAYNTRYAFALGAEANKYDLQSVASHEMGHGYGLGHSNTAASSACLTLYPYATLNAIHGRTLGDGDLTSIQNRY